MRPGNDITGGNIHREIPDQTHVQPTPYSIAAAHEANQVHEDRKGAGRAVTGLHPLANQPFRPPGKTSAAATTGSQPAQVCELIDEEMRLEPQFTQITRYSRKAMVHRSMQIKYQRVMATPTPHTREKWHMPRRQGKLTEW